MRGLVVKEEKMNEKFCCPECGKEAAPSNAIWIHFLHRLDLPYFVCGDCRTVYCDKILIKRQVSWLRKIESAARRVPFKILFKTVMDYMNGIIEYNVSYLGYRVVRFKKR